MADDDISEINKKAYEDGFKHGQEIKANSSLRNDPHPMSAEYRSAIAYGMFRGGQLSVELGYTSKGAASFADGFIRGLMRKASNGG